MIDFRIGQTNIFRTELNLNPGKIAGSKSLTNGTLAEAFSRYQAKLFGVISPKNLDLKPIGIIERDILAITEKAIKESILKFSTVSWYFRFFDETHKSFKLSNPFRTGLARQGTYASYPQTPQGDEKDIVLKKLFEDLPIEDEIENIFTYKDMKFLYINKRSRYHQLYGCNNYQTDQTEAAYLATGPEVLDEVLYFTLKDPIWGYSHQLENPICMIANWENNRRMFSIRAQLQQILQILGDFMHSVTSALEIARLYKKFQEDTSNVSSIQRTKLPRIPEKLNCSGEISFSFEPAMKGISGDFLCIANRGKQDLFFTLGDVAGKGLIAGLEAMKIADATDILSADYKLYKTTGEILELLNKKLIFPSDEMFAMALCGILTKKNHFHFSIAGDIGLLVYKNKDKKCLEPYIEETRKGGLPLGIDKKAKYKNWELKLEKGDFIIALSDGMADTIYFSLENDKKEKVKIEQLLIDKIESIIHSQPEIEAGKLNQALQEFGKSLLKGPLLLDDTTILVIKIK